MAQAGLSPHFAHVIHHVLVCFGVNSELFIDLQHDGAWLIHSRHTIADWNWARNSKDSPTNQTDNKQKADNEKICELNKHMAQTLILNAKL